MTTAEDAPGMDLAIRAQPVLPMQAGEARQMMQAYQELCASILEKDDVQDSGDGREFVKRSGFQKLAAAYGVSTELVSSVVETVQRDGDTVLVARVIARATHPSGRHADGDGVCASNERRFRRGDQRMEHNLTATASTRAVNRAISNLVAFGSVSAEEAEGTIDQGGPARATPQLPDWAAPMNDIPGVAHNLTRILKAAGIENTHPVASEIGNAIFKLCDGEFPFVAARIAGLLADAVEKPNSEVEGLKKIVEDEATYSAVVDPNQTTIDTTTNEEQS